MTADTRPVAQEAAAATLLRFLAPHDALYVVERGRTRSGGRYISVYGPEMAHDVTADVAVACGYPLRGNELAVPAGTAISAVLARLSKVLFDGCHGFSWKIV